MNIAATLPIEKQRWGFWATLGFSAVILAVHTLLQGVVIGFMAGFRSAADPDRDVQANLDTIINNGFYISVAVIVAALIGSLLIVGIVLLRKNFSAKEYLRFKPVPFKEYVRWLGICLVFIFGWGALAVVTEQPGSSWMTEIFLSAESLSLFWISLVIAAPLLEELFFRGFLFEGLCDSRVGSVGAVLVTSILWAAIHVQYDIFQIVMIGMLGVLLGVAKIKTRSLYIPLALHVFINLIAVIQITHANSSVTS